MPKRPTGYYRPTTLNEALKELQKPDNVPLGGGTKLLARDVETAVVDLQDLGLDRYEQRNGNLYIGAMTRLNNAVTAVDGALFSNRAETKLEKEGLLQRALLLAGPNTYRNAATFGGIIASRVSDSELLATLLVFEADLILHDSGEFRSSLQDYLTAEEKPSGLISEIIVPWDFGGGSSHRVARTPADDPIVSITAWMPSEKNVRLAATGLTERPCRLQSAEQRLVEAISDENIHLAAEAAKSSTTHLGDFRGDTGYRADMAAVLTRRALQDIQSQFS